MKKILFFSLTLLIISFLGSCKKDESTTPDVEETTVKGRIVQVYTTIPVPNATVYLYETVRSSSGGLLGGGAHTVSLDNTVTNDTGEYSFTYKRRRGGNEYFIRSFAKNFDEKPGNFYVTEKNSNMDVPIFPYAWIKIRLINLPPVNASDYILVGGWIGDSYTKSGKCDTIYSTCFYW